MRPAIDQHITFLYTRDLATTAQFYEEVLALPLVLDQSGCRIYRVAGDAYLGFCERETAPAQPEGILVTLVTEDVDGWYDHLLASGVPIRQAPQTNARYGIYHCFALDPNGYTIEIQRFLDPAWHTGSGTDDPTS